jgi:hypothetical protein
MLALICPNGTGLGQICDAATRIFAEKRTRLKMGAIGAGASVLPPIIRPEVAKKASLWVLIAGPEALRIFPVRWRKER